MTDSGLPAFYINSLNLRETQLYSKLYWSLYRNLLLNVESILPWMEEIISSAPKRLSVKMPFQEEWFCHLFRACSQAAQIIPLVLTPFYIHLSNLHGHPSHKKKLLWVAYNNCSYNIAASNYHVNIFPHGSQQD